EVSTSLEAHQHVTIDETLRRFLVGYVNTHDIAGFQQRFERLTATGAFARLRHERIEITDVHTECPAVSGHHAAEAAMPDDAQTHGRQHRARAEWAPVPAAAQGRVVRGHDLSRQCNDESPGQFRRGSDSLEEVRGELQTGD